ncbi:uncharacterized protein LOC108679127 [Hyalella azteca]|uniref:Uncharacterized protein LOC108679127 n=1 Tax=Hyalella azteca TaxID=294128 RepID=A0A8B7PAL2_HYAAZ|nr:uncharacterized protein LOC108679127 [Hyalella azteca]
MEGNTEVADIQFLVPEEELAEWDALDFESDLQEAESSSVKVPDGYKDSSPPISTNKPRSGISTDGLCAKNSNSSSPKQGSDGKTHADGKFKDEKRTQINEVKKNTSSHSNRYKGRSEIRSSRPKTTYSSRNTTGSTRSRDKSSDDNSKYRAYSFKSKEKFSQSRAEKSSTNRPKNELQNTEHEKIGTISISSNPLNRSTKVNPIDKIGIHSSDNYVNVSSPAVDLKPPGNDDWVKAGTYYTNPDIKENIHHALNENLLPSNLKPPGDDQWKPQEHTSLTSAFQLQQYQQTSLPQENQGVHIQYAPYQQPSYQNFPQNQSYNCYESNAHYPRNSATYNGLSNANSQYSQACSYANQAALGLSLSGPTTTSQNIAQVNDESAARFSAELLHSRTEVKTVTHPLLPSTQKPLVVRTPVIDNLNGLSNSTATSSITTASPSNSSMENSLSMSYQEQDLIQKVLQQNKIDTGSVNITCKTTHTLKGTTKPKGEISVVVKNIPSSVNATSFKKIFQAFGRLPGYTFVKNPAHETGKVTAVYTNIEGASRAMRVLSTLVMAGRKLEINCEEAINYNMKESKLEETRDKDIRSSVTKILCKDEPELSFQWTDGSPNTCVINEKELVNKKLVQESRGVKRASSKDCTKSSEAHKSSKSHCTSLQSKSSKSPPRQNNSINSLQTSRSSKSPQQSRKFANFGQSSKSPSSPRRSSKSPSYRRRRSRSLLSRRKRSRSLSFRRRSKSPLRRRRSKSPPSRRRRSRSRSLQRRRRRSPSLRRRRSRSRSLRRRSRSSSLRRRRSRSFSLRRRRSRSSSLRRYRSRSRSLQRRRSRSSSLQRRRSMSPPYRHRLSKDEQISPVLSPKSKDIEVSSVMSLSSEDESKNSKHEKEVVSLQEFQKALVSGPKPLGGSVLNEENFNIKITSSSMNLSQVAVNELNDNFGGTVDPVYDNGWLLQVPDARLAAVLVKLLHRHRLLDGVLIVSLLRATSPVIEVTQEEVEQHEHLTKAPIELHNKAAVQLIQDSLDQVLDIFLYKLEPCTKLNCSSTNCPMYHSRRDRRRDPRQYFYRSLKCPETWMGKKCVRGEECELCHSELELLMHPDSFLVSVCDQPSPCAALPACQHVHPGTPDMFYHAQWEDLYVGGLQHTIPFIAGAIRNLHKLDDDAISGVQVLAALTDDAVCRHAGAMLESLAQRHGVKICVVITGTEDPSGSHVIIGTLHGLLTLLSVLGSGPLSGLCAFVVDDMAAVFKTKALSQAFRNLMLLIETVHSTPGRINKVGVCERVKNVDVLVAKELFSKNLRIVRQEADPEETSSRDKDSVKIDSSKGNDAATGVGMAKSVQDVCNEDLPLVSRAAAPEKSQHPSSTGEPSLLPPVTPTPKVTSQHRNEEILTVASKHGVEDAGTVSHRSKDAHSLSPSDGSDSSLRQKFLAEEQALRVQFNEEFDVFIEVPELHPKYEELYEEFVLARERVNAAGDFEEEWSRFWRSELEKNKRALWSEKRKELLEKFKKMMDARSENKPSHQSFAPSIIEPPDIPEDAKLVDRSLRDTSQDRVTSKNNPEKVAHHNKFSQQKFDDSRGSFRLPAAEFSSMSRNNAELRVSQVPEFLDPPIHPSNSSADDTKLPSSFSMDEAVRALSGVQQHLGFLGSALARLLLETPRESPKQYYETLLEKDNLSLYNLCCKKLQNELPPSRSALREYYDVAIWYLTQLPKFAESELASLPKSSPTESVEPDYLGLDIKAIARATEGKSSSFVISFIKCTLELQNKSISKEELNKIFLAISELHFDMSLSSNPEEKSTGEEEHVPQENNPSNFPKSLNDSANNRNATSVSASVDYDPPQPEYYASRPEVHGRQRFDDSSQYGRGDLCAADDSAWHRTSKYLGAHSPPINADTSKSSRVQSQTPAGISQTAINASNLLTSDLESLKQVLRNAGVSTAVPGIRVTSYEQTPDQSSRGPASDYSFDIDSRQNQRSLEAFPPPNASITQQPYVSQQAYRGWNEGGACGQAGDMRSGSLLSQFPDYNRFDQKERVSSTHLASSSSGNPGSSGLHVSDSWTTPRVSYIQEANAPSHIVPTQVVPQQAPQFPSNSGSDVYRNQVLNEPTSRPPTGAGRAPSDSSYSQTWFSDKVKSIISIPNLTLNLFNARLSTMLSDKPAGYKFSRSDLRLVKELQELGSLDVDEKLFLSTLKAKFATM